MGIEVSIVYYVIGKSHYGTAYFYESPVLPRTLEEFKDQTSQGKLETFPRDRLTGITGLHFKEIRSKPSGTWYLMYGNLLLESGRLD
jgi:hypothetical protein